MLLFPETFDVTAAYNSLSTIVYPNNVALSASFNAGSNYAFSGITSKNGNTVVATGSVSNNVYSATWTKPLPGTYTLTLTNTDNKGNTFNYASTPTVSVPVRLSTVYVGPSATGAGTGIDSSNLILWDNVAAIATDTAKIIFTAGTYSNFYGKTINKGWTLSGSGNVVLDAGNKGRIFSISGSNTVKIEGMTLQNGKVTTGTGGAIYNNGATLTIDNCKFYGNTALSANIIGSTNTVTVTNSVLQNALTISNTDINYGVSKTITGSFINTHPASVTLKLNNTITQTATVSDSLQFSATFSNLAVGSYVVTMSDSNGNSYTFDDSANFNVNRIATVYVSNSGTSTGGTTAANPTTWDNVANIITDTGTIYFRGGTYSSFAGKTIAKGWTLKTYGDKKFAFSDLFLWTFVEIQALVVL